jgi:glycosyltransferase involved in cell wall biosynthesis
MPTLPDGPRPARTADNADDTGSGSSLPEVTVVIPTRNRWRILVDSALTAALVQEDVDHEIVVVDDGSSDGTSGNLAALDDPRVRVVRHDRSLGVAKARNAGIRAARGAWIALLDDDDIWSPQKLRRQIDVASSQGAGFVYAAVVFVDEHKRFLFGHAPPAPETLLSQLIRRNVMWGGCSNVVIRSDTLRTLGAFDEDLFQLADWDLWIRLADASRAAACSDVLVGYVTHGTSMLLTHKRDVFREFEYLVQKHRALAKRADVAFEEALFARWVAGGHVRAGRRLGAAKALFRGARASRNVGNLARIPGALLGEPAMRLGRRLLASVPGHVPPDEYTATEPEWLRRYW